MRMFKKKSKQIQEENAREIARIVKESFEKFRDDEIKSQIYIPKPTKFYCMEWKFYKTPQDYNTEMSKRIYEVDLSKKCAYDTGKFDTAKKILTDLYKTPLEDLKSKIEELASEYHVVLVRPL